MFLVSWQTELWVLPGFKGYMHRCHFILHCIY